MRGQTQYNIFICYVTCAAEGWNSVQIHVVMQFVQIRTILCKWFLGWNTAQYLLSQATSANEGWNTVKQSFVMQLVQIRGGTQYNMQLAIVQMRLNVNFHRWGVELDIIFTYYATCVVKSNWCRWGVQWFVMQLVQMRGGTQYNIHLLCNLCR